MDINWDNFETYFFDLDDTLINTRASIRAGWEAAMEHPELPQSIQKSGVEVVDYLCLHFSSNAYHEYWKAFVIEMLSSVSDPVKLANDLCTLYEEAYWKNLAPFPGVPEILELLQSLNKTLALITNGILDFQHQKLKKTALFSVFENTIFCSESFPFAHKKPSPVMLQTALKQLQSKKESTVFLGNAPIDIIAGNLAQITTVAVTHIHNPCQLKLNTPDAFLHCWKKLKTTLER